MVSSVCKVIRAAVQLRWMLDVLVLPVTYTARCQHEHSFRSLQLAHQASLREKKNLLQTALRFQERAQVLMVAVRPHIIPTLLFCFSAAEKVVC